MKGNNPIFFTFTFLSILVQVAELDFYFYVCLFFKPDTLLSSGIGGKKELMDRWEKVHSTMTQSPNCNPNPRSDLRPTL